MVASSQKLPTLEAVQAELARRGLTGNRYEKYSSDPASYAREVLGVDWWSTQVDAAEAILKYPKVGIRAGHATGKDHLAGGLVNWNYDCFNPGLTLCTAPTDDLVKEVLWGEVREQRKGREGLMPRAARMESAPKHYAAGYTARDASAFQGRHEERVGIIFTEAQGIDAQFYDAAAGMLTGPECWFLSIYNPLDTASRMYEEELKGDWHIIVMSCLDHPNIAAELRGELPPFPKAIRLSYVETAIRDWCSPILASDKKAGDVEWPPQSGNWFRPGQLFESKVLGRWPSQSTGSVWAEAAWEASLKEQPRVQAPLEIGCDVARFGDDDTCITARRGRMAISHEWHNGWATDQTAGRLKQLAGDLADGEDPKKVLIKVDDDGVGGGVTDQKGDYNFQPLSGANTAIDKDGYPNRRSEFWFAVATRANEGNLDISRLSQEAKNRMRRQAMAPTWKLDSQGRRVVEPKDQTKKRIGRSPDDMDSLNLAFAPPKRTVELKFY